MNAIPTHQRIDAETVIYRLEEAGRTMLAVRSGSGRPKDVGAAWPDIVRDFWDCYGHTAEYAQTAIPSAAEISRMDEAMAWVGLIELTKAPRGSDEMWSKHGGAVIRKIVLLRAMVSPRTGKHLWSWRRIGQRMNCNHMAVSRWHAKGIDAIVDAINNKRGMQR